MVEENCDKDEFCYIRKRRGGFKRFEIAIEDDQVVLSRLGSTKISEICY